MISFGNFIAASRQPAKNEFGGLVAKRHQACGFLRDSDDPVVGLLEQMKINCVSHGGISRIAGMYVVTAVVWRHACRRR